MQQGKHACHLSISSVSQGFSASCVEGIFTPNIWNRLAILDEAARKERQFRKLEDLGRLGKTLFHAAASGAHSPDLTWKRRMCTIQPNDKDLLKVGKEQACAYGYEKSDHMTAIKRLDIDLDLFYNSKY